MRISHLKILASCSLGVVLILALGLLWSCRPSRQAHHNSILPFAKSIIDNKAIGLTALGDINGDGYIDIVSRGEPEKGDTDLVWYEYPEWHRHFIMSAANFRSDAIGLADIDGDQDLDLVFVIDEPGKIFWLANPGPSRVLKDDWSVRMWIGTTEAGPAPDSYIKDLSIADFNLDGHLDIAARTHQKVFLFFQNSPQSWIAGPSIPIHPHEGMDIGDLDGDGDVDIVLNGFWMANPTIEGHKDWQEHLIDPIWWQQNSQSWMDNNCKVKVADVNRDGRLDVILSNSEKPGFPLIWYENRKNDGDQWAAHTIAHAVDYCHSLQAEDLDLDGDLDIVAAQMPKKNRSGELMAFINAGDALGWSRITIDNKGTYSAQTGDIGSDGDIDIVGGRSWDQPPLTLWENKTNDRLSRWTYIQVDDRRDKWGDNGSPKWLRFFGLAAADLTHDKYLDIASGRYFYRSPGNDLMGKWERIDLGRNVDAVLMVDVDGDQFGDIIAQALPDIFWLEALDIDGNSWKAYKIGQVPATDHGNSQGYAVGQIVAGVHPELILTGGNGEIYYFEIPSRPEAAFWPRTLVTTESNTEGVAVGDIDGDGLNDLAAAGRPGSHLIAWWKNPGQGGSSWIEFSVGTTDGPYPDRLAVADLNGDRRLDIVVTEETKLDGAKTYWFEQPMDVTAPGWPRHVIVEQYTTNSMDTADMDGDGDIDIITGEHRGTRKVAIWENIQKGRFWVEHIVDSGKESHLGARVFDMDNDGDYDVVSIAWDEYKYLHLWRNDAQPVDSLETNTAQILKQVRNIGNYRP